MTLKFPRSRNNSFPPPKRAASTLRWLKPIIPTIHVYQICFISISHVRYMYTHTYIFPFSFSFHPPTVITWFLSMKMGIVVERKEKGIRRRVKGKKEETDRSSIQIARGIFFKALSADPLCCNCSVLDRDYNHHGKGGQWNDWVYRLYTR